MPRETVVGREGPGIEPAILIKPERNSSRSTVCVLGSESEKKLKWANSPGGSFSMVKPSEDLVARRAYSSGLSLTERNLVPSRPTSHLISVVLRG